MSLQEIWISINIFFMIFFMFESYESSSVNLFTVCPYHSIALNFIRIFQLFSRLDLLWMQNIFSLHPAGQSLISCNYSISNYMHLIFFTKVYFKYEIPYWRLICAINVDKVNSSKTKADRFKDKNILKRLKQITQDPERDPNSWK